MVQRRGFKWAGMPMSKAKRAGDMDQVEQHLALNDAMKHLALLCREKVGQKLKEALDSILGLILPIRCLLKWTHEFWF